ncbi:hypothetical protein CAPTEDRAFT_169550 [Capitella teleta]|uniref:Alpha-1,3-glucosyltransferase n=1 Tax=Capitella teleta TaxID=283909 RepID=R7TDM2_CAPTE|nr:hypothetical protein CAPTEDRAFT_169550 [Capitella teleta]|eukprot:ELT91799.1 hypothetical protein CAPTEDRAFT_169550 [Capitella teleta]
MFGDFEAQRHWMEITYNLPVKEWYHNTSRNDLQYWGLDYPPLTAYHSYICGAVGSKLNSSWMTLIDSRGAESPPLKNYLRQTVLLADLLVFIPACFLFFGCCFKEMSSNQNLSLLSMLLSPGLILIDHGHFQYNCISLGLALWAVVFLCKGHDLFGSIAFVLALNYKQMELYHAMPFFCYLLGKSCSIFCGNFQPIDASRFLKLFKIGSVVIVSFVLCWFPFLWDRNDFLQVLHRLFPFARGLYEDKVASFWFSVSVIFKMKDHFETVTLTRICLLTTIFGLLPSSVHLFVKPRITTFVYALVNSSLVFFLFSFQVHEKSILLAALPVSLLHSRHPTLSLWFSVVASFSMFPLLAKDGLVFPFLSLTLVTTVFLCMSLPTKKSTLLHQLVNPVVFLSLFGMVSLLLANMVITPPAHLPDLFPVLIAVYSCAHFMLFAVCFHYLQFTDHTSHF